MVYLFHAIRNAPDLVKSFDYNPLEGLNNFTLMSFRIFIDISY